MKKRVLLVTLFLLSTILAACGGKTTTSEGYELVKEDKFIFASSGEFAPFSVTDGSGNMTGFDIEVGEAIAAELGLEPEQEKYTFASIVEGVKNGRFDAAVASHTITEERLKEVDFSTPYYYSGAQIFVRPDSDIQTMDDLEGMEIAVSRGSTYADLVEGVSDNIVNYDSDVVALEALNNGRHDAVVTDFVTGREAIGSGMELEARELLDRSEQAVAVAKGNEALLEAINEALETLRENGKLKEISEEYFGEDITSDPGE
ncbi:transporter substrate-binding domain-containing protein [Sutcliffiella horikoshii]|uniref:Transporter substrate-binding domain-containing protein n=1 Tax=Sutcliffiella horikoshii TaxID=79883 RepID=A0A5D4T2W9_9BACI|nr:transporter substrate-binding domain-containing protein [Sutcliffiella horikoshii]TYS68968.1 transporter substrate-binding domain-containing protein [Sutcliffiella horikoshii]